MPCPCSSLNARSITLPTIAVRCEPVDKTRDNTTGAGSLSLMFIHWLILAASIWVTAWALPGIEVKGVSGSLWVSAVFGLLSLAIGKLLFVFVGISTFGLGFLFAFLGRWVGTALLLKLTDALLDSLKIRDFRTALGASAMMSLLGTIGEHLLPVA